MSERAVRNFGRLSENLRRGGGDPRSRRNADAFASPGALQTPLYLTREGKVSVDLSALEARLAEIEKRLAALEGS